MIATLSIKKIVSCIVIESSDKMSLDLKWKLVIFRRETKIQKWQYQTLPDKMALKRHYARLVVYLSNIVIAVSSGK